MRAARYEIKKALQPDLANLNQRLGIRVLRYVFDDFLCVRSETRLISFDLLKQQMTRRDVRSGRSRFLAANPLLDQHSLEG